MKFFNCIYLSAAFLPLSWANESGCLSEVVDGQDYFPNKVVPEDSTHWSIEYENTYKILTNTAGGVTYLLYQCGTEVPADQLDGRHEAVLSVPLTEIGITTTTQIPFIEILGERVSISAYLGQFIAQFVSSPCTNELFNEGLITEVSDPNNETVIDSLGVSLDLPAFVGNFGGTVFENQLRISLTEEDTNLGAFEWIKYYAVFYNLEETANEIYDATKGRWDCAERNAGLIACEAEEKPLVLWGSYNGFCGGWEGAVCPNYYCEFAEACHVDIVNSEDQGSIFVEACGRNYMTTEEFIEYGQDADVWIYSSTNIEEMLAEFGANLTDFVSVQNEMIYDTQGTGRNAWFEQRLAEPDVILQDFCNVVGRENLAIPIPHTRAWLRNVFIEVVGNLGQCTDVEAPFVPKATACEALPSDICAITPAPAPLASPPEPSAAGSAVPTTNSESPSEPTVADTSAPTASPSDGAIAHQAGIFLFLMAGVAFMA